MPEGILFSIVALIVIGVFVVVALMAEKSRREGREDEARRVAEQATAAPISSLIRCPDCGREVSIRADRCPHCGAPSQMKLDVRGAWCPNCGNRNSVKSISGGVGCLFWVFVLFSMGLALLAYPFLPRQWECLQCRNTWRA